MTNNSDDKTVYELYADCARERETMGTLCNRTAEKDSGWQNEEKMLCKIGNTQSQATLFCHSPVLSLPAVLLRKVSKGI